MDNFLKWQLFVPNQKVGNSWSKQLDEQISNSSNYLKLRNHSIEEYVNIQKTILGYERCRCDTRNGRRENINLNVPQNKYYLVCSFHTTTFNCVGVCSVKGVKGVTEQVDVLRCTYVTIPNRKSISTSVHRHRCYPRHTKQCVNRSGRVPEYSPAPNTKSQFYDKYVETITYDSCQDERIFSNFLLNTA